MKSKPIPTSPQNHPQRGENQTFERPRKRPGHYIFLAIVLSIIFGFLSGLVAVFSSDYLSDHIPVLKSVLLQAEPFSGQVIVRGTDNFITERNKAITNLQNNYGNSLVGIYEKKEIINTTDFYSSIDRITEGLVLTKDGYIVVPASLINNKDNYVVVSQDNQIYDITHHWLDPVLDIEIIKISVDSFPSITFTTDSSLAVGQEIFQLSADGSVYLNSLANKNQQPVYQQSDFLEKKYLLNNFQAGGLWAFDYQGELVGLLNSENSVELIPAEYISQALKKQLSYGGIVRNSLGISYVPLSEAIGLSSEEAAGQTAGILLSAVDQTIFKTEVVVGDIITQVNDLELSLENSLNEVIQSFQPNQEVIITYWHNAQEKQVNLTLGVLE